MLFFHTDIHTFLVALIHLKLYKCQWYLNLPLTYNSASEENTTDKHIELLIHETLLRIIY